MRLLDTTTFELRSDSPEFFATEGYSILSHRWIGAEITFDEIERHAAHLRDAGQERMDSPQLDKIRGACQVARTQGFKWIWIDNICINKASTTEERESIISMFRWYRDAQICITYLSDVKLNVPSDDVQNVQGEIMGSAPSAMSSRTTNVFQTSASSRPSEWFFRGWTLQELLAPRNMHFYDMDWDYIGAKSSLANEIQDITGIHADYITGVQDFRNACVATKFSWMASRTTTRVEDITYSMLGLFNTTMIPNYGEGQRAFLRLQKELLSTTTITDESMFAWKMPDTTARNAYRMERSTETTWNSNEWGLLAPSPTWFHGCGNVTLDGGPKIERPSDTFEADRYGCKFPLMYLEENKKYTWLASLSMLLLCVGLPVAMYFDKKVKKQYVSGVPLPLNCWLKGEDGEFAAIAIWLSVLPESIPNRGDSSSCRAKRIKCTELSQVQRYTQRVMLQTTILQPEISFRD